MSDFKADNAPNSISAGVHPRPRWGAYSAPPDPLAVFKGPTSKGKEGRKDGRGRKWKGRGGEGKRKGGEGDGGDLPDQCQTAY